MKTLRARRKTGLASARKRRVRARRSAYRSGHSARRAAGSRVALLGKPTSRGNVKQSHGSMPAADAEKQRADTPFQPAVRNFELAVRAFQRQNFEKAKEIFEKLANSAVREVAERARIHLQLCQQKLSRPAPPPKTPEDHYTVGVAALNVRRLDVALEHLTKADKLKPNQEHIRYALAAAHAQQGNVGGALEHLKAAIVLRPENRIQARQDEDFQSLVSNAEFRHLVYPKHP